MAEGSYEYECMRAELLGVDKPDYEEFMKKQKDREAAQQEVIEVEQIKELEERQEDLTITSGKLDELNSILAATQKKLDRFKVRCGSVTELIRTKIGSISGGSGDASAPPSAEEASASPTSSAAPEASNGNGNGEEAVAADVTPVPANRKSDLSKALDNHVDKLDSLLDKTENAHYTMREQNKQMKRFL